MSRSMMSRSMRMLRSAFTVGLFVIGGFLTSAVSLADQPAPKRIVFIAGGPSHDFGSHEHYAGSRILADVVKRTAPGVVCEVVRNGWPADESILDGADAIVIYSDGGGGHPSLAHLPNLSKHMDRGAGLVCLHYAVEVPKDRGGPEFLKWLGGYFETHWSVNPHWTARFEALPKHPITSGVKPFETRDEWYFHMRFREGMQGVTPILSAVAPASTMDRPDGPHSGNPDVRRAVAKGEPQHVAWASERPNGGRAFGYTGGHFHWNWGRSEPTRLVANAILWAAHLDVPESGAAVEAIGVDKLIENQDEPVPGNFNPTNVAKEFGLVAAQSPAGSTKPASKGKLLFSSKTVNSSTSRHQIDVDVDVRGVKKLYLIVTPGEDGFSCDWADWVEPVLVTAKGEKSLLDLDWFVAQAEWGQVRKNANAAGGPLQVRDQVVKGIGTHATSVIGFELPEGSERLKVGCALDHGGVSQNGGTSTSVRFHIAADAVPDGLNQWGQAGADRTPENAVAGLKVADGVQATLAASEPMLKSLTNLDIDARGRVWVCEVVNYRRHNGERAEGDRILILEDTNQDGVMDSSKVFYQGRDIDSALGICVLGNRVLVSAAPYVLEFLDENGDDVPDSKRAILTKTGDPQHDHSVHSFVFGPDGKLYFNFGNTGHRLCDADGKPILDRWGREINDSGKPYRQGMVFRCNEDLSDMEVLGHNFRNNYEAAVDSFGALWQSDNDDDGNRATRINHVMEFGNYGYVDEVTGAGWQAERTNWETEIPQRHWHLNDPGVVPTMLITGAGSPTGITVYEGALLPERFRNQVIHCDAGPNVVRAYPAKNVGAGYSATIEDLAVGEYDKWFRPADVAVAPDGSLYVTDWYDPGVGGHNMQDMERGRLFRLAPEGAKYIVPKFDLTTANGAVAALANPCNSVRYAAFHAIQKMGAAALPELKKMASHSNPRMRARALWLLSKMGEAKGAFAEAAKDSDANVRATAVRLARQAKLPNADVFAALGKDTSPVVLRELAIALREDKGPEMPALWASLAQRYDGQDRWYLEALGIAASDRWDDCLMALAKIHHQTPLPTASARGIAWRARGPIAAKLQAQWLQSKDLSPAERLAFFRATDFLNPSDRKFALQPILDSADDPATVVEALMRLDGVDVNGSPRLAELVRKHVIAAGNDPSQIKVLQRLKVGGLTDTLLERAAAWGASTQAVQAIDLALETGGLDKLQSLLQEKEPSEMAVALSKALSLSGRKEAIDLKKTLLEADGVAKSVKVESAVGLLRNKGSQALLIELAKADRLPAEAKPLLGPTLRASEDPQIAKLASELFPVLKSKQNPLPPMEELVKKRGNAGNGRNLYFGAATCSQCHMVGNEGKNVGPSLTEIGNKLTRDAMFVSILAPSAGISHNYEAYTARTEDGEVITGLLVSKTEEGVTLRDAKGIEHAIPKGELEELRKQEKSLMPDNLQESMTEQDLIDVVEYLMTLKKS
ncbi:MAG: PVC-type heme-binding CxxCH protein [Pirellula sp.]